MLLCCPAAVQAIPSERPGCEAALMARPSVMCWTAAGCTRRFPENEAPVTPPTAHAPMGPAGAAATFLLCTAVRQELAKALRSTSPGTLR